MLIGIPQKWALEVQASTDGGTKGQIALATQLVKLRKEKDRRVSQLPEDTDMPCFWTDEELNWLQASYVAEPARSQRGTLEQLHAQSGGSMSVDEFIWGMSMVQSRTFGGDGTMVFLPFVDLINSEAAPDLDFDVCIADT